MGHGARLSKRVLGLRNGMDAEAYLSEIGVPRVGQGRLRGDFNVGE